MKKQSTGNRTEQDRQAGRGGKKMTRQERIDRLVKESPINPRTGDVWRISDAEMQPRMNALMNQLQDPEAARSYLIKHGFLTKTGRTPKKYGG